jgi:hypothetical protein
LVPAVLVRRCSSQSVTGSLGCAGQRFGLRRNQIRVSPRILKPLRGPLPSRGGVRVRVGPVTCCNRGERPGLSEYYREAPGRGSEALGAYYAEAPHSDRPGETGENFTVFRSSQITGRAAERMGLSRGMSLDVAGMDRLITGQHIVTGEQLTKHRGSPVYERDPDNARKYLLDAHGNKIRKFDAHGKPMIDRSKSTQGLEVITAPPKSVDILTMLAGVERRAEIIAAHEAANFEMLLGYVEKEVRLGKRTIKTPTQVREEAGADGPRVTKGERKGQASKMQGSKYERVPIETAWFSTTQFTSRWTHEVPPRPWRHQL